MKKICKRGYETVQICRDDGTVRPCGWVTIRDIGNLCESTMEEIMHGEGAEAFRQSLMDGSFRYCDPDACPLLANGTIEAAEVEYEGVPDYPKVLYLAYDHHCNYSCTCCRNHDYVPFGVTSSKKYDKIEEEIGKFINKVEQISANGLGELFATPRIMDVLANWKPECEHPSVILESNGSLFTEENWKKIENLGQYEVRVFITVMSFEDAAYKLLSGVNFDTTKLVENLHFIKSLRKKGIINYFEIATVFQERNFRTLPEFTRRCLEEFEVDSVRLRPFFQLGAEPPEIEWFYDIRNAYHPYFKEFEEIMKDPIFDNPKVFHWSGHDMPASRRHPAARHAMNYDILKNLFWNDNLPCMIKDYMEEKEYDSIAVYGGGVLGRALISVLNTVNIKVDYIIDAAPAAPEYYSIKLIGLDSEECVPKEKQLVCIALPSDYEQVTENLECHGFKNIMAIKGLLEDIQSEMC